MAASTATSTGRSDSAAEAPGSALVVVAHPDDCEFACGGTVAKWTRAGADVGLVVVTDGSLGSHNQEVSDEELVQMRQREQEEAARLLGIAQVSFYGVRDGFARADDELVTRLAREIRARRPARLVTHDPWRSYMLHPDHLETGRAVVLAAVRAREPRVDLGPDLPAWRPDAVWLFRAEEPDHREDTSETYEQQLDALLCHRSQYPTSMGFEPGDAEGRERFIDWFAACAADAGAPAGYTSAEEFHRLPL